MKKNAATRSGSTRKQENLYSNYRQVDNTEMIVLFVMEITSTNEAIYDKKTRIFYIKYRMKDKILHSKHDF